MLKPPEKAVNVLITRPLEIWKHIGEESLSQIESVSPLLKIKDISDLTYAERCGDFSSKEKLDALLAEAEVLFGFPPPKNIIARAPKLKWIHLPLAGVESVMVPEIINSSVIVTNSRGIHGTQVSELVFMFMLMLAKQASLIFRLKQEKRWHVFIPGLLYSKTVAVLGLGSIGKEVARLAKAFRMRVVAVKAHTSTGFRYADVILAPGQLKEALSQADYVVNALPFTPETDKIIGEAELRAMKPSAYFINVGRGRTVDEEALIRALEEKWIAGAGLDTLAKEPLPPDSKLWDLPNVIITSHIAGQRADYDVLATKLFCENLKRYINGKRLLNIIDKKAGH